MQQELGNNETPHALGIKMGTMCITESFLAAIQTLPMLSCPVM